MRKNIGKRLTRAQDVDKSSASSMQMFENFPNLAEQNLDLDHRGKYIECHEGAILKEKMKKRILS